MATQHNFRIKNGLEVGGILIVNSSGQLVVADVTSNLDFADNIRARFGDDADFHIHHNSNGNTYIGGSTVVHNSNVWRLNNLADTETIIKGNADGNVELFHNGGKKFETSSTGVTITGTAVTDLLKVNSELFLGSSSMGKLTQSGSSWIFNTYASGAFGERFRITDTGVNVSGDLAVSGNLNITGDINQTSVTTLDVTDKTITVANNAGSAAAANDAGLIVDTGGTNPSLLYKSSGDKFVFNKPLDVTGKIISASGISEFHTAKVNAGGLRVQGGGTYSDPGSQMYLHADASGSGRLAVFEMFFFTGGNNARTVQALKLTSTGDVVLKNNAVLQFGDTNHTIQAGAGHGAGDMSFTTSDDMWFRTRWARFQDIAGSAGEYARIAYNGSWIYSNLITRNHTPQTDSTYYLGSSGNEWAGAYIDTGYFGSLDVSGNVDIDGTLETDILTVDGNPVYIRDRDAASVAGAGYYRVAANTVGGAGRGAFICTVFTTGGSYAPNEVVIQGHADWSSTETIHTVKSSAGNTYFTKARIVRESGDAFLEVYFYAAITDLEIETVAVGQADWYSLSGTLTAATGTETRVGPEVLIAPGLNTQAVVNATQGFQVNNQTVIDNARNIENITTITTEGVATSGTIMDIRPSDTNQMFRVRFPDSSTMEMGTTRAGSGNVQKAVVYGQAGVDINTNGVLRASMTQAGDFSLDADCGGLYFGGSTRSTSTNAQAYIKESGLNLDIKGNDNVRLLGDGGGVILHADYTGKVMIGNGATAPASILHVKGTQSYGSIRVSPTSTNGESAIAFFKDTAGTTTGTAWVVGHAGWGHTGDFVIGNQAFGGPVMLIEPGGNVGIGTTSPSTQLTVRNDSASTSFGANNIITIQNANTTDNSRMGLAFTGNTGIGSGLALVEAQSYDQSAGKTSLNFSVYSGSWHNDMMVLKEGKVGIGTPSPAVPLDVQGSAGLFMTRTSSGLATYIENDGGYAVLYLYQIGGSPKVAIHGNGSSYFNGGNVGIGTSSPDAKLHVDGAAIIGGDQNKATTPIAGLHVLDDTYSKWSTTLSPDQCALRVETYYNGSDAHARAAGDYGGGIVFNHLGGHSTTHDHNMHCWIGPRVWDTPGRERSGLVFATNDDTSTSPATNVATIEERMVIDPYGKVGIGETAPDYTLHVNSGGTNVVAKFESTDSTAGIMLLDNAGNVELSATGSTFNVQPSGGAACFIVSTNVGATGAGGAFIPNGKRLAFDQSGVRSWTQYAAGGNLLFASGDGSGAIQANNFTGNTLALAGALTSTVASGGGVYHSITHTGNESWSWAAQSGSGVDDYLDVGISGGTRAMSWHEDGKVGIGTTSFNSQARLEVNDLGSVGKILLTRSGSPRAEFSTNANEGELSLYRSNNAKQVYLSSYYNSYITGGFLGIGTSNPTEKLHVEGSLVLNVASSGIGEEGIFFRSGFSNSNKYNVSIMNYAHDGAGNFSDGISINGYDGVSICTGSNTRQERVRIRGGTGTHSGNVGIGSINPLSRLDVVGQSGEWASRIIQSTNNGVNYGLSVDTSAGQSGTWGAFAVYAPSSKNLIFDNNGLLTLTGNMTISSALTIPTGSLTIGGISTHAILSIGTRIHERVFNSSYGPNGVANQMYKLNLGNSGGLNGLLEITVQGTYSYMDVSGYVKRSTNIGINPNGSIWRNDLISVEQYGQAANSIVIGPVQWDSSASQYYVNIYKITSNGNAFTVGVKLTTASGTDGGFSGWSLSSHTTLAAPTGYTSRYADNARPQNVNRQYIKDTSSEAFRVAGHAHAAEFNLPSSGMLDWANGDARIIEGVGENYSLSIQTYDGSACNTNTRFDGDNSVHHFGSEFSFLNNKIDMHYNSTPNGLSAVPTMRIGDYGRSVEEFQFNVSQNGTARICFKDNNWSEGSFIKSVGQTGGSKIHFGSMWNSETELITMDLNQSVGKLGVNTSGPDYTLDVNGDVGINEYIYHNGDSDTYWRFQSDRIDIRAGGSDTITVKPTQLDINQSAKYSGFSTAGGQNRDQAIYIGRDQTDASTEYFTMGFKTTARSGEQMQPTTGPYNGGTAFYMECGSTEAGGICLDQDSVHVYGSSDGGSTFRVIDKDSDITTFEMLQTTWDGRFRGNVIAYGAMSSISDRRIKTNITPIEPVLDKIQRLGVYKYNKITAPEASKDKIEIGVIAQEIQKEFPDLVNEETVDPEKTYGLDTLLTVDYEHLTAVLLKGMQEQQEQINLMKKQIEELTSKFNEE